ncbi:hypothetical protein NIES4071_28240 [Calothrix sp. NIES-4071]|nr:hypothetical protein NIES4071_28240 [Calothrix sp. NIES-4071]BAZ57146.1 hypothetical protein NIES4105_28180 [Calothrix sp. NIES-4105]
MNKIAKALLVTLAIVAPLSLGTLDAQAKVMPHANAKTVKVALAPTTGAKATKVRHAKHHAKHHARAHKNSTVKHLARK